MREAQPQCRRDDDLRDRPRDRDGADREQIAHREVHPDAEHQEDDADLRELRRELRVGDEPGRERADHDPREEVADERRQPQPESDVTPDEGEGEADGDRRDQRRFVGHGITGGRGSPAMMASGRYSTNVTFPVLTSSIAPTILISPLSAIPRSRELLSRIRFTASVTFLSATRCTNA